MSLSRLPPGRHPSLLEREKDGGGREGGRGGGDGRRKGEVKGEKRRREKRI